jgi:hypothetical protein
MPEQKQNLSGTRPPSIAVLAGTGGCRRNVDLDQFFQVGVRDDFRGPFKASSSVHGRALAGIRHWREKHMGN